MDSFQKKQSTFLATKKFVCFGIFSLLFFRPNWEKMSSATSFPSTFFTCGFYSGNIAVQTVTLSLEKKTVHTKDKMSENLFDWKWFRWKKFQLLWDLNQRPSLPGPPNYEVTLYHCWEISRFLTNIMLRI